jgi:Ser/Thr protein kinase RdoA (MazF antagonist)
MMIPKPKFIKQTLLKNIRPKKSLWTFDEIEGAMNHYNLGDYQVAMELGGGCSDNILLQTKKGKKVLKRFNWGPPTIKYEHSIISRIFKEDKEFPAPYVEFKNDGSTFTQFANRHYAIYDYVHGFCYSNYFLPMKLREKLVAQAAATLARFHKLMVDFVPDGEKFNGFMPDGNQMWRGIKWHLEIIDKYLEKSNGNEIYGKHIEFLLEIKDELKQRYSEVARYYEDTNQQFPKLVIHGDFSPHNILFNYKGVKAVLDFGDSNLNLRVADIGRGLSTFTISDEGKINKRLSEIFIKSYHERYPILKEEILAIPDIISRRYLMNLVWSLFNEMEALSNKRKKMRKVRLSSLLRLWEGARSVETIADELKSVLFSSLALDFETSSQ